MAKDPNESNCIEEIILKCEWEHWPFLLMGKNVATLPLGLRPRQGLTKVRAENEAWESHFHAFESVGRCEGMNPRISKWAPILRVRVLMDSWIFRNQLQGSKFIRLKNFLYHWKTFRMQMFKMGSHVPFEYLKHELWWKKGMESKCQFDSRPLKVENHLNLLTCK
jgi:hypothetical protein